MPIEILMPALSPTMEEGTLAKWLVKEGDTVSSGDLLAEIETDKATMEFEAVDEGTVGRIVVSEGSEGVKVNSVIAVLLTEGESADDIGKVESPAPEADADTHAAPASSGGDMEPAKGYGKGATDAGAAAAPRPKGSGERVFASPLARRIAADKGLDLADVAGSGPHGRIVKADVEGAVTGARPATAKSAEATKTVAPAGQGADAVLKMYADREFEEVKLDGMRRIIATRLTEAKQTIPHFYLRRDIHLDALLKFRGQINKTLEPRGVKLSVNDFIIKACALALQAVPDANAVWAGDRILKLTPSDVAVAVAIEGGLFTPDGVETALEVKVRG